MLQKTSILRLIYVGILASLVLAIAFGASKNVVGAAIIGFVALFLIRYFTRRNGIGLLETLPVALFVIVIYCTVFLGDTLWLLYFLCWIFWFVLSDAFFPKIFAGISRGEMGKGEEGNILLALGLYFFAIPGMVFFFIVNLLSTAFP